jgi:hypothetical protein
MEDSHVDIDRAGRILNDISRCDLKIEYLQEECPRKVRLEIAERLTDWEMVGRYLDLSEQELTAVERENHTEAQRRVAMLETWHKREGKDATHLRLANALLRHGRKDLVELLCQIVKKEDMEIDKHHVQSRM